MSITVRTQEELDRALGDNNDVIHIDSDSEIWLTITDSDNSRVVAWGYSRVVARGSSRVVARGSSRVVAWDSSRVVASDSSRVVAWDSSSVVASGSSSVVVAWGSSSVVASGASHVEARDSSSVVASGSSHVEAWDSSHVEASKYVAVHLWSQYVTLTGNGHIINLTDIDFNDPVQWCSFHGVEIVDGVACLYKAVGGDWKSDYGTSYEPGSTPEAPDWNTVASCGNGLHFCAHPQLSMIYKRDATKFVKCGVRVDEMVCLNDKIKAKRVVVACVEVDRHRKVLEP